MLIGGIAWHIASAKAQPQNIVDVWNDFLLVIQGKEPK